MECKKLLTQPTGFGSALSISDLLVLTSLVRNSKSTELKSIKIAMTRAIKIQQRRVVCRRNRFLCNGVSIYDKCLCAALEENVETGF